MRPASTHTSEPLWRALPRRSFVAALLGGGIAGTVGLVGRRLGLRILDVAPRATEAAVDAPALGTGELDTLKAFGSVLVPSSYAGADSGKADRAGAVIEVTLRQLAADSAGELRAGAAFLDASSRAAHGVAFAALDGEGRRQVVDQLLRPYTTRSLFSNPYFYVTEHGRRVRSLWSRIARPIIDDFYTSPLGWEVVGYRRRPGECSNLTDYQFPVT